MIYDLSLPISPALAVWPGDAAVEVTRSGERIRTSRWVLGSHAGTHVDAPLHFSAGPGTLDDLDPAILLGPCRVLALGNVPLITAATLAAHDWRGVTRLLLQTGNSRHWADDPTTFDRTFTGLDAGAARLLRDAGVRLLGVDGPSVEPFDGDGSVHEILLGAGMILLETLNLTGVPAGDYDLICAPLKLAAADGAPARVFLRTQECRALTE